MKREFIYSFAMVLLYLLLHFTFFLFAGNETASQAMLAINIPLVLALCFFYFKNPTANASNLAIISTAVSIFAQLLLIITLKQGLGVLLSIYFWIPLLERIAIPFAFAHFAKKTG